MSTAFRSDIEGLRAIAVLPVVAFHLAPNRVPGGFVGVDVFFVISGYLITGLLLTRMEASRFSVLDFYAARIRRIFPALCTMLAASIPVGAVCLSPEDYAELGKTIVSTSLYYSNYQFNALANYFGGAAELKPLLHTWSLAVEEQFYIVFPVLLLALRRRSQHLQTAVLITLALVSLAHSVRLSDHYPALAFYSPLTRAFELLFGAVVALYRTYMLSKTVRELLSALGLGMVALSMALLTPHSSFPGWRAAIPALGTALLLLAGQGASSTVVGRLLSIHPLRWFGMLSYSLYLWHWPAIVFFRHFAFRPPEGVEALGCAALATSLAYASYRLVEAPFRSANLRRETVLILGGLMMTGGALAGALLQVTGGIPQRFDERSMAYFAGRQDRSPERSRCHANNDETIDYEHRCRFHAAAATDQPLVAVWADSHGTELALALGQLDGGRPILQITSSGCPPALEFGDAAIPRCADRNRETLERLTSDRQIDTVVLASYIDHHLRRHDEAFRSGLRASIGALRRAGKRVIVVAPFPHFHVPVPAALGMLWLREGRVDGFRLTRHELDRQRRTALELLTELSHVAGAEIFDPSVVLCDGASCPTAVNANVMYFDEHHISMHSARLVAEALARMWAGQPVPPVGR